MVFGALKYHDIRIYDNAVSNIVKTQICATEIHKASPTKLSLENTSLDWLRKKKKTLIIIILWSRNY